MTPNDLSNVPNLITSLEGPLQQIEKQLLESQTLIENWLDEQFQITKPPIYCSVDLRNSGFKLAPVDTNLFPAGFNNLHPDFLPLCIRAAQSAMAAICPKVTEIILIPEDHTRNMYYYENVAMIKQIFVKAGFNVKIGSLLPQLKEAKTIKLPSGESILLEPLVRQNGRLKVNGFSPCLVLLNNDLSSGIPEILQNLSEQMVMPPLEAGWSSRLKSDHFAHYAQVVTEFSSQFELDPWLLAPNFRSVENVNFMTKQGDADLIKVAKELLEVIKQKYQEYGITENPYLVIKADSGTYGMAVMTLHDPSALAGMNRKDRSRMASIKGGREVNRVIIQEGVHTIETFGKQNSSAEPVIYMIGREVVGGFYRVHGSKGTDENLNAPGMSFESFSFAQTEDAAKSQNPANRFYAYSIVSRLALLAAARELQTETKSKSYDC
jgi:glutamate--cysteine ligase